MIKDLPEGYLANLSLEIKQTLSKMLKGYDRDEVAQRISVITGKKLSRAMLDKLVSSNPSYQPDISQVHAICSITGDVEVFRVVLAKYFGVDVITKEDKELLIREGLFDKLSKPDLF